MMRTRMDGRNTEEESDEEERKRNEDRDGWRKWKMNE